ncbi:MAG TPA: arsenic resistance N-acetyltransferase ArsN2 [Xanthobacteraceae bacterium]|nr:arsenic resistance N-acetyltransferase ArsN2 [Xanthobacteraceae bacterium]
MTRRLIATPLQPWERDGVTAALVKAGLPADDVDDPYVLLWRFETYEDVPVGFGGLEIYDDNALLRSVVTLPPLRQVGMGAAIVAALEAEARARRCRAIYLLTTSEADFFSRLGYQPCARDDVPKALRASRQFAALCPPTATVMSKTV